MSLSGLQHLIEAAGRVRAACIGDVMLDRFVYGVVDRVSPEAPIPVMNLAHERAMLGGAGNVARNLAALGASTTLVCAVGRDEAGRTLEALIGEEAGLVSALVADALRPTTVKTRFIASGQQLMRLDHETNLGLVGEVEAQLAAAAEAAVQGADVVLLSDYAKGVLTRGVIAACMAAARKTGAPVVVDPKGRDFARYGAVDLIKPNAKELALATGLPTQTDAEVEVALSAALEGCAAKAVLVTRAGAGMSLRRRGEAVRHFRGSPRQVFDVSGAGDTALSALGAALAVGADLEAAAEFALLASGVVVGKIGTAVVTPGELVEAEMAQRLSAAEMKIAPHERMMAVVQRWRGQGLRVGFTNGCFDILHRGHVAYLSEARRSCDRLIVGLNTDASVRALKGEGRPVNDLESRAMVLAGLACVDLVVPFDAPTPVALIEGARPDVLLKGADYTKESVVGADFVLAYGGEVVLVPLVEGYSTTSAINRMTRKA